MTPHLGEGEGPYLPKDKNLCAPYIYSVWYRGGPIMKGGGSAGLLEQQ